MSRNRNECIIIFTKDRPVILSKTLLNIDMPVIVLDDSTNSDSEKVVKNIPKNSKNIHYHGKNEQQMIVQRFASTNELNSFVKPLGSESWTLGYARNYAIILAKILGFERILFMDDDIIVKDFDVIFKIFDLLNNADFVGAEIKGMPDLSVVDVIMQQLGMEPYRFMSGGFLAFNLESVSEYFLNYYNEDWVWLFMHKPKAKLVKYGEVYQLPYDPFENAVEKALQQEFGEILVEGLIEIDSRNDFSSLKNNIFWQKILKNCESKLKEIKELCKSRDFEIRVNVCSTLLEYYKNLNSNSFVEVFNQYFNEKTHWLDLIRNGGAKNV